MSLVKYVERKRRLLRKLEEELSADQRERAQRDHHARRPPRPCGMTIHTGIGCPMGCRYCYIYDMGFPGRAQPYPLSGRELLYALMLNPYVAPGYGGTMFALGAVTEPFLPETKERTLEYLRELGKLGNPTQISTKLTLEERDIYEIAAHVPHISVLMTIIAVRDYRRLEPNAPPPEARAETCRRLIDAGLHVSLFIRPIIPGFTDRDAEEILNLGLSAGVKTAVLGTLRVTKNIVERLRAVGIDLDGKLPQRLSMREQIPIRGGDLKRKIARLAEKLGYRVYEAACGANIEASGLGCIACRWGPCGYPDKIPSVDERDILELLRALGYSGRVSVRRDFIEIILDRGTSTGVRIVKAWVKELTRRPVRVTF